jgi:hypothetical protein
VDGASSLNPCWRIRGAASARCPKPGTLWLPKLKKNGWTKTDATELVTGAAHGKCCDLTGSGRAKGILCAHGTPQWIAGGPQLNALYRSTDGGRSWSNIALPAPCTGPAAAFSPPEVLTSSAITMTATVADLAGESVTVKVCTSSDHGSSWVALASPTIRQSSSAGVALPEDTAGETVWIVAPDGSRVIRVSGSGDVATVSPNGLSAGVWSVSATSNRAAIVKVSSISCPSGTLSCSDLESDAVDQRWRADMGPGRRRLGIALPPCRRPKGTVDAEQPARLGRTERRLRAKIEHTLLSRRAVQSRSHHGLVLTVDRMARHGCRGAGPVFVLDFPCVHQQRTVRRVDQQSGLVCAAFVGGRAQGLAATRTFGLLEPFPQSVDMVWRTGCPRDESREQYCRFGRARRRSPASKRTRSSPSERRTATLSIQSERAMAEPSSWPGRRRGR